MQWNTNPAMKDLLGRLAREPDKTPLPITGEELHRLLFPPFRPVRDCVILAEEPASVLDATFDKVIKTYFDKTAYEACNTEARIDVFLSPQASMQAKTRLALTALEVWRLQLKQLRPEATFCLILCADRDHVEIRFHTLHAGEPLWLDENLENYRGGAVGYAIV